MTTKKYLCNAPRPTDYEVRAAALLKSLGGDETKLKRVVRKSLRMIRRNNPQERRTGPGRKSNAEHAMAFYFYLLGDEDFDDQEDDSNDCDDSSSDDDENEGSDIDDDDDNNNDKDDDGKRSIKDEKPTQASSTSQSTHQDEKVVTHTTSKEEEEERKESSVSSSKEPQESENSYTTTTVPGKRRPKVLSQLIDAWGELPFDEVKGRRARKKATLYDPKSDTPDSLWQSDSPYSGTVTASHSNRTKRNRDGGEEDDTNNPTHDHDGGDKQNRSNLSQSEQQMEKKLIGTSSKQVMDQSPEIGEDSSDTTDSNTESLSKSKKRAVEDRKRSDGSLWCNYCMDDPKIKVCVFCACRVCFGKHDKTKLLLCDGCDEEYHTHCVGLTKVPTSAWFCPTCKRKRSNVVGLGSRKSIQPKKLRDNDDINDDSDSKELVKTSKRERKPLRVWSPDVEAAKQQLAKSTPRRNKKEDEKQRPIQQSKNGGSKSATSGTEKKRGPGRPPKSSVDTQKRGPGRPPSSSKSTIDRKRKKDSSSSSPSPPKKRGPGRPRKDKTEIQPSTKRKGPGRPPMSESSKSKVESSASTKALEKPTPVTVSRSGRTVKRQRYHDEIEDGPQLLHSDRHKTATNVDALQADHHSDDTNNDIPPPVKATVAMDSSADVAVAPSSKRLKATDNVAEDAGDRKHSFDAKVDEVDKDDDMSTSEELYTGPVRMKTVLPSTPVRAGLLSASLASIPEARVPHGFTGQPNSSSVGAIDSTIVEIRGKKMAPSVFAHHIQTAEGITANMPKEQVGALNSQTSSQISKLPGSLPFLAPPSHPDMAEMTSGTAEYYSGAHANVPRERLLDPAALEAAVTVLPDPNPKKEAPKPPPSKKSNRRKPGARECIQMSKRFGPYPIPERQMRLLLDYCNRGKVEHLIRMRERLDDHSRFLEHQLAGLEMLVQQRGESTVVVPAAQPKPPKGSNAGAPQGAANSGGKS